MKTRWRDAGPWKLLVDVKIFFNFKFCWRARVSISSIVCLYNVLKRVSLMILADFSSLNNDDYRYYHYYSNALSFPSALCQFLIVFMLSRTKYIKQRIQRSDAWCYSFTKLDALVSYEQYVLEIKVTMINNFWSIYKLNYVLLPFK